MFTMFDQFFGHKYQGRIFSFKIGGQETEYTLIFGRAVKFAEAVEEALPVQIEVFYIMPAVGCISGAAAFKNLCCFKFGCGNAVGFKKGYG